MHIVTRVSEGEPLETVWRHTGWNIFGAILTDIFGFGALAFAEHPGLASFGRVALVGLAMNLVICVVLLPAFLATWQAFFRERLRPTTDEPASVADARIHLRADLQPARSVRSARRTAGVRRGRASRRRF